MVAGKGMARGGVAGAIVVAYERVRACGGGRVLFSCLFLGVCVCWCVLGSIPGGVVRERVGQRARSKVHTPAYVSIRQHTAWFASAWDSEPTSWIEESKILKETWSMDIKRQQETSSMDI